VGQLTRLRELHLRNNRLSTLPAWMGEMLELRQIDLRGNPLQSLPEAMATLPRLEKIDLRWVTTLTAPGWIGDLEARGCLVYW
jgi:Leucine-rich repeat (LRR) protein